MGGFPSVRGGIVAGVITSSGIMFVALDRAVDIGPWFSIVSGLGVIFTVIFNPEGIVGPAHAELDKRRQANLRQAAGEADDHTSSVAASLPSPAADGPASVRPAPSVGSLTVSSGRATADDAVALEVAGGPLTGLPCPQGNRTT